MQRKELTCKLYSAPRELRSPIEYRKGKQPGKEARLWTILEEHLDVFTFSNLPDHYLDG